MKSRKNVVSGRVVGFSKGKGFNFVLIDIGRKENVSVDMSEFLTEPIVGNSYDFVVVKETENGSCIISRIFFEKRKSFDFINNAISSRTPMSATVFKQIKNGYLVNLSIDNAQKLQSFLFTKQEISIDSEVTVIITSKLGSKIKCVLKGDDTMPLQPGEIIEGKIVSCNDFFGFVSSSKIPEDYEANIYKSDYSIPIEPSEDKIHSFKVLYCDKRNIFLSLVMNNDSKALNQIKVGNVYEGKIESIKSSGLVVNVNNVKVFVNAIETDWSMENRLDKFKLGTTIKVRILFIQESSNEFDEAEVTGSIRRNGEGPNYFDMFIKDKKVGDIVEVIVKKIKVKKDEGSSKILFVSAKDSEFFMILHVGIDYTVSEGSKIKVRINGIKPESSKVVLSINNNNSKFVKPRSGLCRVTEIVGYTIWAIDDEKNKGRIRAVDVKGFRVGDEVTCKIKKIGNDYIFTPMNYNNDEETVEKSTFGGLFDDIGV